MVRAKEKKPARITIACNACRSRKQKCSGDKPVCVQCLDNNRPCDWPEQLRRGPAKGHVEALEHRLQLTEGVLLRMLSQVSDMQLSSIFPRDNAKGHDSSPTYIPLARVDRKGIQDWSQFPLDNVQNIRDWQYTCIGQGTGSSGTGSIKPSPSSGSAHQERGLKRKFSETSGAQSPASSQNESSVVPGAVISPRHHHDQPGYSPVASRLPLDHYWLSLESVTSKQQLDSGIPFSKDVSFIGDGPIYPEELQPVQTSSNWEGAPSANFQQRFLW